MPSNFFGPVDVNLASASQLEMIPMVTGPVTASKMIRTRPFADSADFRSRIEPFPAEAMKHFVFGQLARVFETVKTVSSHSVASCLPSLPESDSFWGSCG